MNEMKNKIDSRARRTVKVVKEDVEKALEIERRKLNLVIHGTPESDAEHDIDQIADCRNLGYGFAYGLRETCR